jgi:hypothetical protein
LRPHEGGCTVYSSFSSPSAVYLRLQPVIQVRFTLTKLLSYTEPLVLSLLMKKIYEEE